MAATDDACLILRSLQNLEPVECWNTPEYKSFGDPQTLVEWR